MATHTQFKGTESVTQVKLSGQLEANLKLFLDWALLGTGGYQNVTLPAAPTTTAGPHRLRLSDDPGWTQGKVWEGFRKDWVWETGVGRALNPIDVSGVWVGGSFKSVTSTGTYAHTIDYPNGRIIFGTALPTGSHVAAEYSYRKYQVYANSPDWFRQVQMESYWGDAQFLQQGSGAWGVMADARVQTPAVVVRAICDVSHSPLELGNLTHNKTQSVAFNILGDNPGDVAWMHDVLVDQKDKNLRFFDLNDVVTADKWPLTGMGARKAGAMMYPDLVAETGVGGYWEWRAIVEGTDSQEQINRPPLRHAAVLWKVGVTQP